jgi:DNA processing protein
MFTATPTDLLGSLNAVELKHAPPVLYLEGRRDLLEVGARVAVVGSRKASEMGLARARKLTIKLVEHGVVVVSGLAAGIDTAAHTTAIARGGATIAVLGTPLDRTYPADNAGLQRKIGEEHLIVSQFCPGTAIRPQNFPIRNRTMALLSDATVIVEAAEKSGAISQGWEALRLGRELYIMQAVVLDKSLSWPADLIGYGAQVLSDQTLDQLLDSLPLRGAPMLDAAIPF